jgi:hypothetical protein
VTPQKVKTKKSRYSSAKREGAINMPNDQKDVEQVPVDDNQDGILDFDDNEDDWEEVEDEPTDKKEHESISLADDEDEEKDSEPEPETKEETDPEDKPAQTAEENAKFAETRRQQQLDERLKQEREKWAQESPEAQIAKMLAQRYNVTPEQMLEQLREQELTSQAEKQGVPVEVLKQIEQERKERERIQQELNQMQFENWKNRVESEKSRIKGEYPMLTDEDMNASVQYMLETMQNPNASLEDVVYAVHGKKIAQSLRDQAKQEALAEISGRAKSPLAPQGGKPNPTVQLTAEEKYVAKQMGVSEKDYLKYKA